MTLTTLTLTLPPLTSHDALEIILCAAIVTIIGNYFASQRRHDSHLVSVIIFKDQHNYYLNAGAVTASLPGSCCLVLHAVTTFMSAIFIHYFVRLF